MPFGLWLVAGLLVSGLAQALISPPLNWVWIFPVYLAPGLWAISKLRGRRAFLGGWLMGTVANLAIFYWLVHTIGTFSNLPLPAALGLWILFAAFSGLYLGFFAWGFEPLRRISGAWWPVTIAAWFVACEFLNPQLFPYYQGSCGYQVPSFFLITTVTGVPGVTFQMVLWNLVAVGWWMGRSEGWRPQDPAVRRGLTVAAGFLAVSLGVSWHRLGAIQEAEAEASSVRVAIIQPNLGMERVRRLRRERRYKGTVTTYLEMTGQALDSHPGIDAVVWPEGAIGGGDMEKEHSRVRKFFKERGVELWAGYTTIVRELGEKGRRVNSAGRIDKHGQLGQRYDKNILLPFGEFMPGAQWFPFLRKIRGPGRFVPGDGLVLQEYPEAPFCFLICYEAIRHGLVADAVGLGARLLVNVTYDAWFGDTSCPSQHLMLAALQAAQYGVPLVRGATTGISAVVDTRGLITASTEVFVEDTLVADVPLVHLPTLYGTLGDWFAWLCVAAAVGLLGWSRRRAQNQKR